MRLIIPLQNVNLELFQGEFSILKFISCKPKRNWYLVFGIWDLEHSSPCDQVPKLVKKWEVGKFPSDDKLGDAWITIWSYQCCKIFKYFGNCFTIFL